MYKELPLCRQPYQQDNAQDGNADNHSQDIDDELQDAVHFHHAPMERACRQAGPGRPSAADHGAQTMGELNDDQPADPGRPDG
jgi:hypothetical protein